MAKTVEVTPAQVLAAQMVRRRAEKLGREVTTPVNMIADAEPATDESDQEQQAEMASRLRRMVGDATLVVRGSGEPRRFGDQETHVTWVSRATPRVHLESDARSELFAVSQLPEDVSEADVRVIRDPKTGDVVGWLTRGEVFFEGKWPMSQESYGVDQQDAAEQRPAES
jgi:hypothetical protein